MGWKLEQEHNLHYVAITRARKNLYYVRADIDVESEA
jgi:ATP-dependent exoDNAse (exonuclease V) beta subunit